MASFNLTVEDCSPLISYSPTGAWADSSSNDTLLSSYSGSSYHSTSTPGAAANITFNGTGIAIFGGHRQNYGTYQISVDGQNIANASSAGQDAFQQVMGSASGLSYGQHTAILTSSSSFPIDIDFIDIQTQIGEPGSQLSKSTIDDTNSSFIYSPASEWSVNDQSYFINNTLHYTSSAGASASVTFSGEAVALYGTVSQDHADIQLTLDGKSLTFGAGANGFVSTLHSEVLLYYAQGLEGSDQHTLSISADPQSGTGPFIDVDAVVVYSTSSGSSNGPSSSATPSSQGNSASSNKLPAGTIAGATVGGVLGLLLLLIALFFSLRWLRRRRQTRSQNDMQTPLTPTLPIQNPDMLEAGLSNGFKAVPPRLSQNSIASFYSGPETDERYLARYSRTPSATESFASTAPINATATNATATNSRDRSVDSNTPTRPNLRPPPLAL
jgi:hypothetical protein